ncbi:MAG TPA: tripartite tricarboxylate transporter substrate binding protein [Xanthobacteraceae bacterium]|jgi:tripartite-type tricarboxylate transporter receptor subunit TctC
MNLPRRRFLHVAGGAAALATISRTGWALDYPTRPVRVVVGYPAGSATDVIARLVSQWLSERLGQPFLVENRTGAGSNIATEAVAHAPPDGYTLLLVGATNAVNASLYQRLNFNFVRDIAPVAGIVRTPFVMEVTPSFPAQTVSEFIAYAKANPGKINMGSAGIGSANHIFGELFQSMTGINMVHVPYRSDLFPDLIAGQVQVYFGAMAASIGFIKSGKVRALAVTTAARWEGTPDIPTIRESVPGYEASGWYGIGAPEKTPPEVIDKLNSQINAGLIDPKVKSRLVDLGGTILPGSPADFGKLIAAETEKWGKVIQAAGIKAE